MVLEYKGININFSDEGKGATIVLLHGFLESSNMWKTLTPLLIDTHRIICIDLLGHGKTGCLGYIHTMEDMAEVVSAVLNYLKVKQHILIAHSMGGYVSLAYTEKNQEKVKGLCLVNSTSMADSKERKLNRDRAINAVKNNHKAFIGIAITNLFSEKNRSIYSKEIEAIKKEALATPLQGIVAALEGMKVRVKRENVLKKIAFPKTMFISKNDPVLDYNELINEAKDAKAKIVKFPDGHMSYIENEGLFLQEIMHFIENI